jgi:D-3-phosphoglycerate dehydrogenase
MINTDVPGVIGQVGTLLGSCGVNIAEWRLGRNEAGTEAMSFVNLDTRPSDEVLEAIRKVPAVRKAVVAEL